MQYTFKVGDIIATKTMKPGAVGEIIFILDRPSNNILVKRKSLSSDSDCVDFVSAQDILPPVPIVVFETTFKPYSSSMGYLDRLKLTQLSDGTWKIEKVA